MIVQTGRTTAPSGMLESENRFLGLAMLLMLLALTPRCVAQQIAQQTEAPATSEADDAPQASPLSLDDLPPPPSELAELIQKGNVTFVIGGQRPSDANGTATTQRYDRGYGRRGRWGRRLSFDAETNFKVHLDYQSRCRWRIRWQNDERRLIVTVRFSDIEVNPTHVVWFKHPIAAEHFWDSELVRHEFDHVRLSVLVANRESFSADLREHATIDIAIEEDADVDRSEVLPLVEKRVNDRFAELLDLIEIRYQELDRQTRHGTRPLDKDSELFPMLRPEGAAPDRDAPASADTDTVRAGEEN